MARSAERAQFLADIIVTATEGGIQYWAEVTSYHWYFPDMSGGTHAPGPNNTAAATVSFIEAENVDVVIVASGDPRLVGRTFEDENSKVYTVSLDQIASAVNRVVKAKDEEKFGLHPRHRRTIREASRENDAGEIDADLADCLLQLAVFDEVVYG